MKITFICLITALAALAVNAQAEQPLSPVYLILEGGVQRQQDLVIKDSDGARISFDLGYRVDFGLGARVNRYLALEFASGLMHNNARSLLDVPLNSGAENLDHYQVPVMANVICTVPVAGPFQLRAGAGVGAVYSVFLGWQHLQFRRRLDRSSPGNVRCTVCVQREFCLGGLLQIPCHDGS